MDQDEEDDAIIFRANIKTRIIINTTAPKVSVLAFNKC